MSRDELLFKIALEKWLERGYKIDSINSGSLEATLVKKPNIIRRVLKMSKPEKITIRLDGVIEVE